MSDALLYTLLATVGVSLVSLIGIFLVSGRWWNERIELRLVSFAAGILLGTAFLDLLPEALESSNGDTVILGGTLAAIVGLFLAERFLHARHDHSHDDHAPHLRHHSSSRYFILLGDGAHNFIDGVAIGAAFLIDPALGLATTLAVVAHEIPHEIADYSILIHGGYSRARALSYNFLSALTAVAGGLAVYVFGSTVEDNLGWLLAASAGMFIYIGGTNLIPELHHQRTAGHLIYATPFLVGVAVMIILTHFIAA